jgi:hypothetical protein
MTSLGFENYGEALKIYLARYREVSTCEVHLGHETPMLTFFRTWLLVASTNVPANPVRREKQGQPTTALTTPSLSEIPWTHPRKAQLTSLAIRSRISLSTRSAVCDAPAFGTTIERTPPFSPFRCIYVAIGLPLERES